LKIEAREALAIKKIGLQLRLQETGGDAVVAVKRNIVERGSHAMPARHSRRLGTAYVRHGGREHISEAQGLAHQNDLQLNRSPDRQMFGTEKIDARGTDIASGTLPTARSRRGSFKVARGC
jgi:hypothetical protein